MGDRPIIFSAPMVRALLAGHKTQTRRLFRPHGFRFYTHPISGDRYEEFGKDGVKGGGPMRPFGWGDHLYAYLPYAPGDRLYVRESWCHTGEGFWSIEEARRAMSGKPIYRASDEGDPGVKWWPSIHMPREFSRLTLTVSDVRVQRLQDISEDDAQAEGVPKLSWDGEGHWFEDEAAGTYRCGFAGIWQHLHSASSWDENPWVCAISFNVRHGNIDQLREAA